MRSDIEAGLHWHWIQLSPSLKEEMSILTAWELSRFLVPRFHLPKFWFNSSGLYSEHQDFKSSQLILSCSLIEICSEKKVGSKKFHYLSSNLRASAQDSWLVVLIFLLCSEDFRCNGSINWSCTRTSTLFDAYLNYSVEVYLFLSTVFTQTPDD